VPRLAANLSMLFKEVGFLERFAAARRAGFRAVEYQYPYDFAAADVAAAAREAGVEVVLHNVPRGDPQRNEHGTACLPGREQAFRESLERAVEYARAVRCPRLHCLAGVVPADTDARELHRTYVANLKYAAQRLIREKMHLLIEPVSEFTAKQYFLRSSTQAIAVLDEVGADNAFLQYDFFHMQVMEGNLADKAARLLARIGHMQVADVPGRHEPGSGEINFGFLFRHVDAIGYGGWIGCEYNPKGGTAEGLKWATPYL
jgi:hydroxypyruvate isomerase